MHTHVCALGHATANDNRLSRNERVAKLLGMLRSLLRAGACVRAATCTVS
jgi:hypothetical protein